MKSLLNDKKIAVHNGKSFSIRDYETDYKLGLDKQKGKKLLEEKKLELAALQDKLYAQDKYSLLIIFQAMDAAGKDGTIKSVFSGVNPQGCDVTSFKKPSVEELDHDYLWRCYKNLPERGRIGIFNRSYYEEVLVTKVHPEFIMGQRIPMIKSPKDIHSAFWNDRYKSITNFEKHLSENGTVILKFFLNVSKEEQKQRFLERIEDPVKNWKFSYADLQERAHWDEYHDAYNEAIKETAKSYAPWFVIPADNNWAMRLSVCQIIVETLESLKLEYPKVPKDQMDLLQKGKAELMAEKPKTKK